MFVRAGALATWPSGLAIGDNGGGREPVFARNCVKPPETVHTVGYTNTEMPIHKYRNTNSQIQTKYTNMKLCEAARDCTHCWTECSFEKSCSDQKSWLAARTSRAPRPEGMQEAIDKAITDIERRSNVRKKDFFRKGKIGTHSSFCHLLGHNLWTAPWSNFQPGTTWKESNYRSEPPLWPQYLFAK